MKELDLKIFLNPYKNTTVDFFRFPGNYGDSLIWHGTKKILTSLNILTQYVDIASQRYNKILLIDGGGNFVDYYSDVRDFLTKKNNVYDEILILPHTIFGERQIRVLNDITSKLIIFCREEISAKFVEDNVVHAEVYLWHDCAFYNTFIQKSTGRGILKAFRIDKESLLTIKPELNNDLSYGGYATKPLDNLLEMVQKYRQIDTDRLHLAICAALLGKKVRLFPNSYYKNKAVFEYSLKRFPNVEFIESY